jgi:hypothetical protein
MNRWKARAAFVGLALAATAGPSFAAEPSKTELAAARDLFSRAERDEDAGHWPDALDKLRRAGTVKMTPGIRFHIALCEEKLGQLLAALADYNAAEAAARAEGNKDVLDAVADPLAALRTRVPTLIITTPVDVKDAAVTLDGAPLATGLLGTAVPVDVGSHTIQGRASGRQPFSTTIAAVEKQAVTVEVRLPAAQASPAVPPVEPVEPTTSTAATGTSSPKTAAILTTAGAAALVGFGVAAYFVSGGKQSSAETACLEEVSCDNLKGGVRTWDALALTAWIAGAGVGALSVYLWTRPAGPSEKPSQAALRVGPGAILLRGEF